MTLKITQVQKRHKRKEFDCGNQDLNNFLANHARSSSDKRITRSYILESSEDPDEVIGYSTLTTCQIDLPSDCKPAKKLKNPVPALLLAKMAIANHSKRMGHGNRLLIHAIRQAAWISREVGGVGLVIDAKNQEAAAFYRQFDDFEIIDDLGLKLWLPIAQCEVIGIESS